MSHLPLAVPFKHAVSKVMDCDEVAERTLRWYQRPIKRRYLIARDSIQQFSKVLALDITQ